jgi:hypothetical protein
MEKKHQDAILELITTEQAYIDDMTVVHDVSKPFRFIWSFLHWNMK